MPPQYPRPHSATLLGSADTDSSSHPTTPRDQWGVAEWKAYAEFLEAEGAQQTQRANRAEDDLDEARRKASRRKGLAPPARSLLASWAVRKGRPPGATGPNATIYARAVTILAQHKVTNPRYTQHQALAAAYREANPNKSATAADSWARGKISAFSRFAKKS